MFGNFPNLAAVAKVKIDPKDIPPPTQINIPRYQPFCQEDATLDPDHEPSESLPTLLMNTGRSASILGAAGLTAIGADLKLDCPPESVVPDTAYLPNFRHWESLSPDEARDLNQSTKHPLRNGNLGPGCQTYLDRRRELSIKNEDGFRTVRRIPPPKGKQQARLGNAYEFFRCLEHFTSYWDDPSEPLAMPPSPEMSPAEAADAKVDDGKGEVPGDDSPGVTRTSAGSAMPSEFRMNLVSAFIKLVAYDFGCNTALSRVEPRLHMSSPKDKAPPRKTYFASPCSFIYQSPTSREAARAGMVYGPVAAVSARATTSFTLPDVQSAQSMDLAREFVAALITAQHRGREGKAETRFGEGQWWTSRPRWGGGPGGPIGRETEASPIPGEKDAKAEDVDGGARHAMPVAKKPRKNMSAYDNYRTVRPPASNWDKKASYEAIGKRAGATHDDVFVISSLFHHVSVLRVRVPLRLLDVLEGEAEPDLRRRSWGKVEAWRSAWFDLFDVGERVEAMRLVWGVMAYQMRGEGEDVKMEGS